MNTLQELEDRYAALAAEVRMLREVLDKAKSHRDPFAAHIFKSRKALRYANDHDRKSGHKSERALLLSFQAARQAGYQGSMKEWETILTTALF